MNLESDYQPQIESETHSTEFGYSVEARVNSAAPCKIGEQIFDNRWRLVQSSNNYKVAMSSNMPYEHKAEHGLFSYEAAQALRWWVHAEAKLEHKHYCLETRIIKHRIVTDTKVEPVSMHQFVGSNSNSHIILIDDTDDTLA